MICPNNRQAQRVVLTWVSLSGQVVKGIQMHPHFTIPNPYSETGLVVRSSIHLLRNL